MDGFSEEEVLNIRKGNSVDDSKLDALAGFTLSAVANRGNASAAAEDAFLPLDILRRI